MSAGTVWTRLHGAMSGNHWKCPGHQRTSPKGVRPQTRTLYTPDFKLSAQTGPCLFPSRLVCVGEGLRRLDCVRRIRNWRSRPTSHRAGRQQSKLHPRAPFSHLPFPPPRSTFRASPMLPNHADLLASPPRPAIPLSTVRPYLSSSTN